MNDDFRFVLPEPVPAVGSTSAAMLADTIAQAPRHVLVHGRRASRQLSASGYHLTRYLALPNAVRPSVIVPLGSEAPARYAMAEWLVAADRAKQVQNRLVAGLVARDVAVRGRTVALASKAPGPPFLVAAAEPFGVQPESPWFLVPGAGDALSRGVFQLFERGASSPTWALKFARVPGYDEQFASDERGLALAATAGGSVSAHAPRLIGRFESGGVHASLETAAAGQRLISLLATGAGRGEKLGAIERVAEWTVRIGAETARAAAGTRDRTHVLERIAATWPGVEPLVLSSVPAVIEHRDLGSWNVVVGGGSFTVLDLQGRDRCRLPALGSLVLPRRRAGAPRRGRAGGRGEGAPLRPVVPGGAADVAAPLRADAPHHRRPRAP